MKRWMTAIFFAALAATANALPSVAEVESEIKNGNFAQAESMMHEVVVGKPSSARGRWCTEARRTRLGSCLTRLTRESPNAGRSWAFPH